MTREELHELVDIVMDASDFGFPFITIYQNYIVVFFVDRELKSFNYPRFSDFTQAVKDYIKSLG